MTNWQPIDVIVLVLATTITAFMVGAFIFLMKKGEPDTERAKILAAVLTAIISVIGVYIGSKLGN